MSRRKKGKTPYQAEKTAPKTFKVRLNERTVITLSRLEALAFWKQRYPKAHVVD